MMQESEKQSVSEDRFGFDVPEDSVSPSVSESVLPSREINLRETSLQTPKILADKGYQLLRVIGRGTQAHVYEAVREDGQHFAIKELRIDSIKSWKEYDLFHRESEVLQSLQMDGVARFYDAIESLQPNEPRAYIVQELIDGQSLAEMMADGIRLDLQEIFEIAVKLIDLLEKLHHNNPPIIHRDIKPSNIILRSAPNGGYDVFLVDFGAVANPQIQSAGSTVAGTYGYMPPEQLMGIPTPASDIYALGATLVYLLSGVEPAEMQVCDFRLVIEPHLDRVPVNVAAILRQMLDPNISNRLCDYGQLRDFFKAFADRDFSVTPGTRGLGTEDSDKQLQRVKRLGQTGNLSLWNALPDDVPRLIPKVWSDLYRANITMPVSWGWLRHRKASRKNRIHFLYLFFILLPLLIVLTLLISCSLLKTVYNSYPYLGLVGVLASIILPWIFIIYVYIQNRVNVPKVPKMEYLSYKDGENVETIQLANIRVILCQGYKTIATIEDVEYIPAISEYAEGYRFLYYGGSKHVKLEALSELQDYGECVYYHYVPCFLVKYSFNYESKRYVHEIVIHREPSSELEKGSPLPILYYVDKDNDKMLSMPYPYPLGDILKLDDIYDTSNLDLK